ncbi:hypothetical protein [uncultured Cohaesibacter sp.]|uniref:hypothetical protein n=1 Tax=uncultured Cohaesibacter sp. TaxID=1002546 RepID=UPI0029C85BDD|nr:hypothetical protein [uncultured Cohaesibacter sp.]
MSFKLEKQAFCVGCRGILAICFGVIEGSYSPVQCAFDVFYSGDGFFSSNWQAATDPCGYSQEKRPDFRQIGFYPIVLSKISN